MRFDSYSRTASPSVSGWAFLCRILERIILATALLGIFSAAAMAARHQPLPAVPFKTVDGQSLSTAGFKGRPTMLWLLSTWCGSCAAGLKTLASKEAELKRTDLRVVVLRNYQNGGYPGIGMRKFVDRVLPGEPLPKDWVLGQASKDLDAALNARHYPDIYFLIGRKGTIKAVGSAPSATIDGVLAFARKSSGASVQ